MIECKTGQGLTPALARAGVNPCPVLHSIMMIMRFYIQTRNRSNLQVFAEPEYYDNECGLPLSA